MALWTGITLLLLFISVTLSSSSKESKPDLNGIGKDLGENIDVSFAEGVRCTEGRPRGEDQMQYCMISRSEDQECRKNAASNLFVVTTSGKESEAKQRFLRSAEIYKYNNVQVISGNENPSDEDVLLLVRNVVKKISEKDSNALILFIDGPDAILSAGPYRVVEELEYAEAGILLSADGLLRDNNELLDKFTKVQRGRRFLDSGAFVGNVKDLSAVMNEFPSEKSLQDIMTKAYTKQKIRKQHRIKIDHMANLFQNLDGATDEVELRFAGKEAYLQNTMYSTVPAVIRANGLTQIVLNRLGSYLARSWNPERGCVDCWDDMISLDGAEDSAMPMVTFAIFVEEPTPFMEEFLSLVEEQIYPKSRIHLYLHNAVSAHEKMMKEWFEEVKGEYKSTKYISSSEEIKEWHVKNAAIDFCLSEECEFILFLDSDGHLDNRNALKLLIEQNRNVVAPFLPLPEESWSNFWGDLTSDGFYARSEDYIDIVQNNKRGLWNVPFIGTSYLLRRSLLENPETKPSFIYNLMDSDMAFCQNLRNKGVFMYVSNRVDMGHMVNNEDFDADRVNPELWSLFDNSFNWEKRYLHQNYSNSLNKSTPFETPCPDVFWFPIFTERFTKELIELMESYGSWSDGSHSDPRLSDGYENVPTVDIHMTQVDYEEEWLEILKSYVQPLQLKAFTGYDIYPPSSIMNFVVRYRPEEQPLLKSHYDTSTYTINVALNKPKIDFQGGGVRYIRYDCSVVETRVGWLLMHPGRLTHQHEGLRVTGGTRYIAVSFIDP